MRRWPRRRCRCRRGWWWEAKDFPKSPGLVINKLLEKTGKNLAEIDLFEINEAFAAVALASQQISGLDPEN